MILSLSRNILRGMATRMSAWVVSVLLLFSMTSLVSAASVQVCFPCMPVGYSVALAGWVLVEGAPNPVGPAPAPVVWNAACDWELNVPPGDYTLKFKEIPGLVSPPEELFVADASGSFELERCYTIPRGNLAVAITSGPIELARWTLDDPTTTSAVWYDTSATVSLEYGDYTVSFSDGYTYWIAPAPVNVTINTVHTVVTAVYAPISDIQVCICMPPGWESSIDLAGWVLVEGPPNPPGPNPAPYVWNRSCEWELLVPPGQYTLKFKEIPGLVTPPEELIEIDTAGPVTYTRCYTIPIGNLTVNVTSGPIEEARWSLVDPASSLFNPLTDWHETGAVVQLPYYTTHTIYFNNVPPYWTSPETVRNVYIDKPHTVVNVVYLPISDIQVCICMPPGWESSIDLAGWVLVEGPPNPPGPNPAPYVWNRSCDWELLVPPGQYTLKFKEIPGLVTPPEEQIEIDTAGPVTYWRCYTLPICNLVVNVTSGPIELARWSLVDPTDPAFDPATDWHETGEIVILPYYTCHNIYFNTVPTWFSPATVTNVCIDAPHIVVNVVYERMPGRLQVFIRPDEANEDGAMWTVDGGLTWYPHEYTLDLEDGEYNVEFKYAEYGSRGCEGPWITPPLRGVRLYPDELTQTTGTYYLEPMGGPPPGTGTIDDPYLISTVCHLLWMGEHWEDFYYYWNYFRFEADISCKLSEYWNERGTAPDRFEGFPPIGKTSATRFRGYVDGNGHKVTDISINRDDIECAGLFGHTYSEISRLSVQGTSMTVSLNRPNSTLFVGSLAGNHEGVAIRECSAMTTGSIRAINQGGAIRAGGLVGQANILVTQSYAKTDLETTATTYNYTGGLVGFANGNFQMKRSFATGAVKATAQNYTYAGGLIGYSNTVKFIESYADGAVDALSTAGITYAGGLIGMGYSATQVTDCYAQGDVTATASVQLNVGGLMGILDKQPVDGNVLTITNSYSTGRVTAAGAATTRARGGLLGSKNAVGTVTSSYYDNTVNPVAFLNNGLGAPKSTNEMQTQATFVGWNFGPIGPIWEINPAEYPTLSAVPYGAVAMSLGPQAAVAANAGWSLDGGETWYTGNGATAQVPPGEYEVLFKDLAKWTTPEPLTVTVKKRAVTAASSVYLSDTTLSNITEEPVVLTLTGGAAESYELGIGTPGLTVVIEFASAPSGAQVTIGRTVLADEGADSAPKLFRYPESLAGEFLTITGDGTLTAASGWSAKVIWMVEPALWPETGGVDKAFRVTGAGEARTLADRFVVAVDGPAHTVTIDNITAFSQWYLGTETAVPVTLTGFELE